MIDFIHLSIRLQLTSLTVDSLSRHLGSLSLTASSLHCTWALTVTHFSGDWSLRLHSTVRLRLQLSFTRVHVTSLHFTHSLVCHSLTGTRLQPHCGRLVHSLTRTSTHFTGRGQGSEGSLTLSLTWAHCHSLTHFTHFGTHFTHFTHFYVTWTGSRVIHVHRTSFSFIALQLGLHSLHSLPSHFTHCGTHCHCTSFTSLDASSHFIAAVRGHFIHLHSGLACHFIHFIHFGSLHSLHSLHWYGSLGCHSLSLGFTHFHSSFTWQKLQFTGVHCRAVTSFTWVTEQVALTSLTSLGFIHVHSLHSTSTALHSRWVADGTVHVIHCSFTSFGFIHVHGHLAFTSFGFMSLGERQLHSTLHSLSCSLHSLHSLRFTGTHGHSQSLSGVTHFSSLRTQLRRHFTHFTHCALTSRHWSLTVHVDSVMSASFTFIHFIHFMHSHVCQKFTHSLSLTVHVTVHSRLHSLHSRGRWPGRHHCVFGHRLQKAIGISSCAALVHVPCARGPKLHRHFGWASYFMSLPFTSTHFTQASLTSFTSVTWVSTVTNFTHFTALVTQVSLEMSLSFTGLLALLVTGASLARSRDFTAIFTHFTGVLHSLSNCTSLSGRD